MPEVPDTYMIRLKVAKLRNKKILVKTTSSDEISQKTLMSFSWSCGCKATSSAPPNSERSTSPFSHPPTTSAAERSSPPLPPNETRFTVRRTSALARTLANKRARTRRKQGPPTPAVINPSVDAQFTRCADVSLDVRTLFKVLRYIERIEWLLAELILQFDYCESLLSYRD